MGLGHQRRLLTGYLRSRKVKRGCGRCSPFPRASGFEDRLTRPPEAEHALRLTSMAGWVLTMASLISSSMVDSSTCSSPLCREKITNVGSPALYSHSLLCLPMLPRPNPYLPGLQCGEHREVELWAVRKRPGHKKPLARDFFQVDFQLGTRVKGSEWESHHYPMTPPPSTLDSPQDPPHPHPPTGSPRGKG